MKTLMELVDEKMGIGEAGAIELPEVPAEELISVLQELLKAGLKVNVMAELKISDDAVRPS